MVISTRYGYVVVPAASVIVALAEFRTDIVSEVKKCVTISVFERLVIMLNYYCEYRTMRRLAIDYGISKTNVCDIIHWAEDTLVSSGLFLLPSKETLADGKIHCVLIDASEVEIERPQKTKNSTIQERKRDTP